MSAADAAVAEYAPQYRPLHSNLRPLQLKMRKIDRAVRKLNKEVNLINRAAEIGQDRLNSVTAAIDELNLERDELARRIPQNWNAARNFYVVLHNVTKQSRGTDRRNVDGAYEVVAQLLRTINQAEQLSALESTLADLAAVVADTTPEQATAQIKQAETMLGELDGASKIKSKLSKARRALKGDNPDRSKAAAELNEGLDLYATEVAWRQRAPTELLSGISAYDQAISNSIGLRQQPQLNTERAKDIASCLAVHRDISLNF